MPMVIAATGSRNANLLTGLDQLRVHEDIAIGIEDPRREIRVAVVVLRDRAQRLAFLNHVPLHRAPCPGALLRFVIHRNSSPPSWLAPSASGRLAGRSCPANRIKGTGPLDVCPIARSRRHDGVSSRLKTGPRNSTLVSGWLTGRGPSAAEATRCVLCAGADPRQLTYAMAW